MSLQVIVHGIIIGALYACVGMGFSQVYGVLGISNLSHGALLMLGSYVTYWLFTLAGVDPFVSIIPAMAVLFVLGYVMQRLVINRVMGADDRTAHPRHRLARSPRCDVSVPSLLRQVRRPLLGVVRCELRRRQ